jgi:hypothetical protein
VAEPVLPRLRAAFAALGVPFWLTLFAAKFGEQLGGSMVKPFLVDQGFMEWQELARLVGSVDSQGQPAPTSMMVRLSDPDPTVAEVDDVIDKLDEVLLADGIAASQVNQVKFAADIAQTMRVRLDLPIAAIVMAVIGAMVCFRPVDSVFERLRRRSCAPSAPARSPSRASS